MIFYLGEEVKGLVKETERKAKNKAKRWEYGYNPDIDVVIISKDGTLGKIFNIQGLNIGLPEPPADLSEVVNHGLPIEKQKWKRRETPKALQDESINRALSGIKDEDEIRDTINLIYQENFDFIEGEFRIRDEGMWIYVKNELIYMTGTYSYGIQWIREDVDYPNFRVIQNELMIYWEACVADQRSFGMQYVKNRRMGASLMAIFELLQSGTITENKLLGIISKKGDDSSKIFRRLVNSFKRLPRFFKPVTDGTNTPKKKLILDEPTKRRRRGEAVSESNGLSTMIEWHNTDMNAMDGDAIFRSLLDESGKYPKEVPFNKYWRIVKTSHTKGIRITGKSMVVSTVNSKKEGGAEYKIVWDDSDLNHRDNNGQTKSGLYRIFIPAEYCLEGMFDEWGFTIVEDPKKPVRTDEGVFTKIGSITWLENKANSLKDDPEDYNEFMRQFPRKVQDAFRDASDDCEFNLMHLQEQLEHNEFELNDKFLDSANWTGNDEVERGNLVWKDGIQFGEVEWKPDPDNGRWYIRKGCHPPADIRNQTEEKFANGIMAKGPIAGDLGALGVDPYNRTRNADGRGSKGAIVLTTGMHTHDELPRNAMILEYIDRPNKVTLFFEDVLKTALYYSMPFLSEQSNDRFLDWIKQAGFRHFSMNNPFKAYKDLTPAEKEFGGAPPQDSKIGDAQFYATETYVEDHVGVARDTRFRGMGEMAIMPFTRTLMQLKDVDTSNRTKFDAYIAFSLSRLGCQRRKKKEVVVEQTFFNPFQKYDNTGTISKPI